jgi:hypothetical protein
MRSFSNGAGADNRDPDCPEVADQQHQLAPGRI